MNIGEFYKTAQSIIKKYSTNNPYTLCECMNVRVRFSDIGSLKGIYKHILKNCYIIINSGLDEEMQAMVCCHELCHHILHRGIEENSSVYDSMLVDMSGRTELEANMLAAEIMLSDDEVAALVGEGRTAEEIAKILRVNVNFVVLKAQMMKSRGYGFVGNFSVDSDFLGKN